MAGDSVREPQSGSELGVLGRTLAGEPRSQHGLELGILDDRRILMGEPWSPGRERPILLSANLVGEERRPQVTVSQGEPRTREPLILNLAGKPRSQEPPARWG